MLPLRLTFHGIHRLRLNSRAFAHQVFAGDNHLFVSREALHHFDAILRAGSQLNRHLMGLPVLDDIDVLRLFEPAHRIQGI